MSVPRNVKVAARAKPVSERLLAAVRGAGVTRYRISKETGIPQSVLSRFVRGKQGLDLVSVDRLAAYFGMDLVVTDVPDKGR